MNSVNTAVYARVSNEYQADLGTIDSQLAALEERVVADGYTLREELIFADDGYSGSTLLRPALEKMRDMAAFGGIDRLYILAPDRLARKYAYQMLLVEELQRIGVEVIFLNQAIAQTPEDQLLLQVQGIIAEYEQTKIMERSRRGKRFAAQAGQVSVLSHAPYGYRYIRKLEGGGQAAFEVIPTEADVVRQIFRWYGIDGYTLSKICRCLEEKGIPTRTGRSKWCTTTIHSLLRNTAYKRLAAFGKSRNGPRRPRLRPLRGCSPQPRKPSSPYKVPQEKWIFIPVPPLVDEALFDMVQERLEENRRRIRQRRKGPSYLLQGLIVCGQCQYACTGRTHRRKRKDGPEYQYSYYSCAGSNAYRYGRADKCPNPSMPTEPVDTLVWQEVYNLLSNGERLRQEFQRRLNVPSLKQEALNHLQAQLRKVRRSIARLIDSYAEELLEKREFEPRIKRLRQRQRDLTAKIEENENTLQQQADLNQVISHLQDFASQVNNGLENADWETRRELITLLVKRVEVYPEEVNVVFKVPVEPRLTSRDIFSQHYTNRVSAPVQPRQVVGIHQHLARPEKKKRRLPAPKGR